MSAPDISRDVRIDTALRRASFALMEARKLAIISRDPNTDEIHAAEKAVDAIREERSTRAPASPAAATSGESLAAHIFDLGLAMNRARASS